MSILIGSLIRDPLCTELIIWRILVDLLPLVHCYLLINGDHLLSRSSLPGTRFWDLQPQPINERRTSNQRSPPYSHYFHVSSLLLIHIYCLPGYLLPLFPSSRSAVPQKNILGPSSNRLCDQQQGAIAEAFSTFQ
jgi:hypothetical protein